VVWGFIYKSFTRKILENSGFKTMQICHKYFI